MTDASALSAIGHELETIVTGGDVSKETFETFKAEMMAKNASLIKDSEEKSMRLERFEALDTKLMSDTLLPTMAPFVAQLVDDAPPEWQGRMASIKTWADGCGSATKNSEADMSLAMCLHVASAASLKRGRDEVQTISTQMASASKRVNELEEQTEQLQKQLRESTDVSKERYESICELQKALENCAQYAPKDFVKKLDFSARSNREVGAPVSKHVEPCVVSHSQVGGSNSLASDILRSSTASSRVFPQSRGGESSMAASQLTAAINAASA